MKTKITALIIALVALFAGYVISHPLTFGLCSNIYKFNSYTGCSDGTIMSVGYPLSIFMSWILSVVVVASFFAPNIFRSWLYFAAVMILLALMLIANQPVSPSSLVSADRADTAQFAGQVFDGISLIFLAWKYIAARRAKAIN